MDIVGNFSILLAAGTSRGIGIIGVFDPTTPGHNVHKIIIINHLFYLVNNILCQEANAMPIDFIYCPAIMT